MVVGLLTFPDRKQITKPSQEIPVTPIPSPAAPWSWYFSHLLLHPLPSCTMVLL